MYFVVCRSAKRLAVQHKMYIPPFGFNDVHQREVQSPTRVLKIFLYICMQSCKKFQKLMKVFVRFRQWS